jgi:hypothetical protein
LDKTAGFFSAWSTGIDEPKAARLKRLTSLWQRQNRLRKRRSWRR